MATKDITIGVCAMAKKARSKPMQEILTRLANEGCKIVIFEEQMILEVAIEEWPCCDCLIAFFSTGFPLAKAEAYSELRKPFVVNDLHLQWTLMDRRKMYEKMKEFNVPMPNHFIMDHNDAAQTFVNSDDHIEYSGTKFKKPIVEKPTDGDDHDVRIYWPGSSGGGCTKLFRKIENRSSEYIADVQDVRRDGVYLYEEFVKTDGVDVKVYTCGPDYAHAEARKAPAMDGKVKRNERGKEERYPVILSEAEKSIARTVVLAFKQNICGLDLLRSKSGSVVCDVNGWSFVKDSKKYWDDTAHTLRLVCLNAMERMRSGQTPNGGTVEFAQTVVERPPSRMLSDPGMAAPKKERTDIKERLLCVSVVARHADRTPKQKMKMIIKHPDLIAFCDVKDKEDEVKLKQTSDLQKLLVVTKRMLEDSGSIVTGEDVSKLQQLQQVLEMSPLEGVSFYRKVQLKPKKLEKEKVVEALLILKWGGKLTWAGKTQAMDLGHALRIRLYPSRECGTAGAGGSLLRLHATYRHDLKIYTSDEGRVVLSAAAFAKGLLDLDGVLPPIASMMLVSDDAATHMLDVMPPEARLQMDAVKQDLSQFLHGNAPEIPIDASFQAKLDLLGSAPHERMRELQHQLSKLVAELSERLDKGESTPIIVPHLDHAKADPVESLVFVYLRWRKLEEDFYDKKRECYDISKLPDIYDCALYDYLHNEPLKLEALPKLYEMAKDLANFMVPLEYGLTGNAKRSIGISITNRLVRKLFGDMHKDVDESGANYQLDHDAVNNADVRYLDHRVHTRLYFTSESHIISLLNVLRWGHVREDPTSKAEPLFSSDAANLFDSITTNGMAFLTHLVLTVHESSEYPADSSDRFRVRILFSPGASNKELNVVDAVPITPPEGLPLSKVASFFTEVLSENSQDPLSPMTNEGLAFTPMSRIGSTDIATSETASKAG